MEDLKNTLVQIYNDHSNSDGFVLLRQLDEYLNTINSDDFLSKALLLMKEYHRKESLALLENTTSARSNLYSMVEDDIRREIEEKYPLYSYRQLLKIQKEFQYIKKYNNLADIPDIEVTILDEEPAFTITHTSPTNLRRIPETFHLLGYLEHYTEFHLAFIKLLSDIEANGGVFSQYFDYDSERGILYFNKEKIEINERKRLTNAHHLLSFLFQNEPFEQHFYSELEKDKVLLEEKSWKSYYDACNDIQGKVKEKTGIVDFLDFSSGSKMYVRINPLYSMNITDSD